MPDVMHYVLRSLSHTFRSAGLPGSREGELKCNSPLWQDNCSRRDTGSHPLFLDPEESPVKVGIVGGGEWGDAIAWAMGSRFGIGAYFHIATDDREVDTVYMGMYPRAVFERIGLFDEELVRNQDAPVIQDLDSLPFPAFHLFPDIRFCRHFPLELGRGCPFACTFCSTNSIEMPVSFSAFRVSNS